MMMLYSESAKRPSRRRPRSLAVVSLCCLALATPVTPFSTGPKSTSSLTRAAMPTSSRKSGQGSRSSTSTSTRLDMSSGGVPRPIPRSSLSVSLDQPLISDIFTSNSPPRSSLLRPSTWLPAGLASGIKGLVESPVLRVALATFVLAVAVSLLFNKSGSLFSPLVRAAKKVSGRAQRILESWKKEPEGVPMPFDASEEGWGVCTFASKHRLGKSSFKQYTFNLPKQDYVLPLELGQTIKMCCLDQNDEVVTGNFFPYESDSRPGQFSILVPDRTIGWNGYAIGEEAASFVAALSRDIGPGDEVALQPGSMRLAYRGQYLPVTDMLYIACSTGIVPVLDQLRAVLSSDDSSVSGVTVVWINDQTSDFDVIAELLEKEYFKYSSQLDVTCVVEDMRIRNMEDNIEVRQAVPTFRQGTMSVVAGPQDFSKKTIEYLESRGYPRDTICVL